ncbi:DM13 domain-containing protein [Streptomyces sp. DSM 41527]|uniref:DM13 domain-containing protein n=1 Tax=Streptomyces mooreae TaxID=3075523 RepID=A0ABU2T8L7_9ACTN|nr:DM13 domain-containing protein [Streptomyces sp. DSM 41527]MDT0457271.1 DM13 domain-containing protein [Streptomyces sp. DSM 41527]
MSRVSRRTVVPLLLVLVVVAGIGLYLFQPWKVFTDTTVNESLPTASAPKAKDGPKDDDNAGTKGGEAPMTRMRPKDLAEGHFVTHEHDTSGTARTVRLADGGQVLRLEDLKTSEGPDVRVHLSPRAAGTAKAGLDDAAVELGKLKGNLGNQNYTVPAGTDLSQFRSAVIWCERFSVSFGAADLNPVTG